MKLMLKGCYPAIVTPFFRSGKRDSHKINYPVLEDYVSWLIKNGIDGIVVAGCTGSASLLSHDEQIELVKYTQKKFGDKTKIIAGDGSNSTREAIELAVRIEKEARVYEHLSISPYYNKPSDRGMTEHFKAIADNIEGNLILYSVPSRTGGKGITTEVTKELAQHKRIAGIKEASGNIERIKNTIDATRDLEFFVVSGDDSLTVDIIRFGGTGAISVAANIIPKIYSEMINCTLKCKYTNAGIINLTLQNLYSALFPKSNGNASPNPVMCHYALTKLGFDVGIPRLPLTGGERDEKEKINEVLRELDLS